MHAILNPSCSRVGYRSNRICMWILATKGQRCEKRKSNQYWIFRFGIVGNGYCRWHILPKIVWRHCLRNIRLGIESSISGYIRTLSECSLNIEYILYIVYYIEDGGELIYYNLAIIIVIILSLNIPRFSYQCELSKEHINSKQFIDIIQFPIFQIFFYLFVSQPKSCKVFKHNIILVVVPKAFLVLHSVRALGLLQYSFLWLLGRCSPVFGCWSWKLFLF